MYLSLKSGYSYIMKSTDIAFPEGEEEDKFDLWLKAHFGEKANQAIGVTAAVLAGFLSVGLFVLLPTLVTGLLARFLPIGGFKTLIEGILKVVIFLSYLFLVSKMKDIKRVFMYHGAEHKTIFCYEAGLPLTVENARIQSRFHPRCGTSFLFYVIFISILIFSLIRTEGTLSRMGLHLLLLPVIVSISYEVIKWAGRHDNAFTAIVSAPGKALQHLTTAEPDDTMLEVAIEALTLVLPDEKGADIW